jgi:hypothetical protein
MPEIAHQETDSIKVEMEIDGSKLRIEAEIKDPEVFPPIDWENKKVRALLVDLAANQVKNLLSQRFPAQDERKVQMISVICKGCGKPFEVEAPCCGEKQKQITCPHCHKPQLLTRREKKQ